MTGDQWDGFSMWDPNDVSQPTITGEHSKVNRAGAGCKEVAWIWGASGDWIHDHQIFPTAAHMHEASLPSFCSLWSSLWSLLSLLEQSSSVWCKFEPILNPSIHQPDVFSHLERHVGFCLHLITFCTWYFRWDISFLPTYVLFWPGGRPSLGGSEAKGWHRWLGKGANPYDARQFISMRPWNTMGAVKWL